LQKKESQKLLRKVEKLEKELAHRRAVVAEQTRRTVEQIESAEAVVSQVAKFRRRTARPRRSSRSTTVASSVSRDHSQATKENVDGNAEEPSTSKEKPLDEFPEAGERPRRKRKLYNSSQGGQAILATPPSKTGVDHFQSFMMSAGLNVPKSTRSSRSGTTSARKVDFVFFVYPLHSLADLFMARNDHSVVVQSLSSCLQ
jgi:hypothetical protein